MSTKNKLKVIMMIIIIITIIIVIMIIIIIIIIIIMIFKHPEYHIIFKISYYIQTGQTA